jgi:hypothetical protein
MDLFAFFSAIAFMFGGGGAVTPESTPTMKVQGS